MQLQQIDRIGVQVGKTALHKGSEVLAIVTFGHMGREAPTGFGSDIELLAPLLAKLRQKSLASAITVNVGSVEEVDAEIQRAVQRSQ